MISVVSKNRKEELSVLYYINNTDQQRMTVTSKMAMISIRYYTWEQSVKCKCSHRALLWMECLCSLKIHKLKPRCDTWMGYLWEMITFRCGHQGGALRMGLVTLLEWRRESSLKECIVWKDHCEHTKKAVDYKPGSTSWQWMLAPWPCTPQPPKLWEINVCSFKPLDQRYFCFM